MSLVPLAPFTLRSELDRLIPAAFGILEDFAFVIADHDFFVVVIEDVAGIDRHFAAATGMFLNVHKIRADSDKKRCARCTEAALT
jgi:hypothetical protein